MPSPSTIESIQPEAHLEAITEQDEPEPTVAEPELPKAWNIGDPFQYAPPKPDGDHWTLLLEPILKANQMRCDAWKDEVQNLLIFAGLFSAVVTAFIIESYKNLQQSPNDIMIDLLAHIAVRLDGPLNNNSSVPLPVQKPFAPTASSIRVNTFWFISLVLSLTTVLVGIVSLQWLREHQSYPDLSTREKYAVSVMRNEALDRWYVDKIFMAMPLLLQCALILFLGGIVDFLHGFGDKIVLVPVTIVVAFTLIFIVATTLLPALQILSLYFHFSHDRKGKWPNPPNQCPYKSPQSHAFRKILRPIAILYDRFHPHICSLLYTVRHHIKSPFSTATIPALAKDNFTRYLRFASMSVEWVDFDLAWLAIRDGYMRRAFGRSSVDELLGRSWKVNILLGGRDNEILPIHDIINSLFLQGFDKMTSGPAYYAFCEISELTLLPLQRPDYYHETAEDLLRQSTYLHDLLSRGIESAEEATLTDIFDLDSLVFQPLERPIGDTQTQRSIDSVPAMLIHHQNASYYLRYHFASEAPMLSTHRTELEVRLIRYFSQERPEIRNVAMDKKLNFPSCLVLTRYESYMGPDFKNEADFNAVAWQVANVILLVLQQFQVNPEHEPHLSSLVYSYNPLAQSTLTSLMDTASFFTTRSLVSAPPSTRNNKLGCAVQDTFYSIISFFEDRLNREISSWTSTEGQPSLIFYLAALYTQSLIDPVRQNPQISVLYSTVCRYKRRTIDMGITDPVIEERLRADPNTQYYFVLTGIPFSSLWWHEFCPPANPPNLTSNGRNTPSIIIYYPFNTSQDGLSQIGAT